jgi:hypothetical protein
LFKEWERERVATITMETTELNGMRRAAGRGSFSRPPEFLVGAEFPDLPVGTVFHGLSHGGKTTEAG